MRPSAYQRYSEDGKIDYFSSVQMWATTWRLSDVHIKSMPCNDKEPTHHGKCWWNVTWYDRACIVMMVLFRPQRASHKECSGAFCVRGHHIR